MKVYLVTSWMVFISTIIPLEDYLKRSLHVIFHVYVFMLEHPEVEPYPEVTACCQIHLLYESSVPDRADLIRSDAAMPLLLCQSDC